MVRPRLSAAGTAALGLALCGLSVCTLAHSAETPRITSAADLGLAPEEVPVCTQTKVAYLVNPALNRPEDLERMLGVAGAASALAAPGRPGNTAGYDAVVGTAAEFFQYVFLQVPVTERSLHRLVQVEKRAHFPLLVLDAVPRLADDRGSRKRLETRVAVRFFMVHVEGDRERDLRWVTSCELCFEDSTVGYSPVAGKVPTPAELAASVISALRGRIASSLASSPVLRTESGRIDEPRRNLLDRSISSPATVSHLRSPGALPGPPAEAAAGAVPGNQR